MKSSRLDRRTFLERVVLATTSPLFQPSFNAAQRGDRRPSRELAADLIIIGGGLGGCAAALAAARTGLRVIMTEETDWIGGQLTSQAVPPDENPWIEQHRRHAELSAFRDRRSATTTARNYPLTAEARANPRLNPGNGGVSRLCHEPRVGAGGPRGACSRPMSRQAGVAIMLRHTAVDADVDRRPRARRCTVRSLADRRGHRSARAALRGCDRAGRPAAADADGVRHRRRGAAATPASRTRRPRPSRRIMQAFTCCFAMDYLAGEDHTIDKPREYELLAGLRPALDAAVARQAAEPGLFAAATRSNRSPWASIRPSAQDGATVPLPPDRRPRRTSRPARIAGDITLVNWPQNDYWLGNLVERAGAEAARHMSSARSNSACRCSTGCRPRPPARRRDRLEGPAAAARHRRHGGRPGEVSLHPREPRGSRPSSRSLEQHVGTDARRSDGQGRPT